MSHRGLTVEEQRKALRENIYGSQAVQLQQKAGTLELLVTAPPGVPMAVDVTDRWARQVGQTDLARYLGVACGPANPVNVQDTGLNTNPERYLQIYHWDSGAEIVLNAAAAVNLGAAVAAGMTRRVRGFLVTNNAQTNTFIILSQVAPAINRGRLGIPAQTTRVLGEQDGFSFAAGLQPQISSTAAAVGSETYITAFGVEAPPT